MNSVIQHLDTYPTKLKSQTATVYHEQIKFNAVRNRQHDKSQQQFISHLLTSAGLLRCAMLEIQKFLLLYREQCVEIYSHGNTSNRKSCQFIPCSQDFHITCPTGIQLFKLLDIILVCRGKTRKLFWHINCFHRLVIHIYLFHLFILSRLLYLSLELDSK